MEDSVNDQSSAAANARRSSSILRYPLRSATKSKEEKPPAAELSTSAPKRGRLAPSIMATDESDESVDFYLLLSQIYNEQIRDLVLIKGLSSRKVGATSIHSESSQCHIVFTCVIESWCKQGNCQSQICRSHLCVSNSN
ncbi:Kinesin-like protein KIN-12B [Camellia lanceoleosa]|uniref:Kinesin-like protein KIN-12B n=1 Tax=Camellia lanceoleosa TaxID=1840588 RepID=A0ACC0FY06_9ERIC|nr:Kinesin-like protein KIN-12B [Camellia lanceoleosa]